MKKHLWAYYGRKLAVFALSVLVLSALVFFLSRMTPTDPLLAYYGDRTEKMTTAEKDQARARLGLDQPVARPISALAEGRAAGGFRHLL